MIGIIDYNLNRDLNPLLEILQSKSSYRFTDLWFEQGDKIQSYLSIQSLIDHAMHWIEQIKTAIDETEPDIQSLVDELGDDILKPQIIILEHEDFEDFIEAVGGPDKIKKGNASLYTDDSYCSPMEYNMIDFQIDSGKLPEGIEYAIPTQINRPQVGVDSVLNLTKSRGEFRGLRSGIPTSGDSLIVDRSISPPEQSAGNSDS